MKIMPMMSRGVPFVIETEEEQGFVTMLPMQVWRATTGQTLLRIGNNLFVFDEDGSFDGTEHKCHGPPEAEKAMNEILDKSGENKGLAPDEPYFSPGSPGWEREVLAWKDAKHQPMGQNYTVHSKKRPPS